MRTLGVSLLVAGLIAAGCTTTPHGAAPNRAEITSEPTDQTRAVLIFVGGNSECRNDRGLVRYWESIAGDVQDALGLAEDEVSRAYFSWTGDHVDDPGCIPGLDAWGADFRIVRQLEGGSFLPRDVPLIIVGHSNGGATAFDLTATLCHEGRAPDLLVTLDPVSRLDRRAEYMGARTWLHVFVERHTPIITIGGPWKGNAPESSLNRMIAVDHGNVPALWHTVTSSSAFAEWARQARAHDADRAEFQCRRIGPR